MQKNEKDLDIITPYIIIKNNVALLSKNVQIYGEAVSHSVLRKRYSENMQQIYRRTLMPKCDLSNFIEAILRDGCSPVNLWHIFRTPFPMNTSGLLLLYMIYHQLILPLSWLSFLYFLWFRGTEPFKEHLEKYENYSKSISFWGHRVRPLKKNVMPGMPGILMIFSQHLHVP